MTDHQNVTLYDIEERHSWHSMNEEGSLRIAKMREGALNLSALVLAVVPPGRERGIALTRIEEALFWANAAVAREKSMQLATTDQGR